MKELSEFNDVNIKLHLNISYMFLIWKDLNILWNRVSSYIWVATQNGGGFENEC